MGMRYSGCGCQDALAYTNEKGIAVMVHRETVTDVLESSQPPTEAEDKQDKIGDEIFDDCQTTPHFLPTWVQQSTLKLGMDSSCSHESHSLP